MNDASLRNGISRRTFLRTSAAALATAPILAADAPKPRPIRKGFMLSSFPEKKMPVAQQFQMIKAAGFDGVEPHGLMDQDEVLRARDAAGLEIPSVVIGGETRMLGSPDPAVRTRGVNALKLALRDAKRYGARSVLTIAGGVSDKVSYTENYERCQAGIREAIPLAAELGVKIAIENVWNHFLLSPVEMMRFVDEFESPWVGVHFDIGNVMYIGWPEHWIRALGKRIVTLHFKEYSRKKHETEGLKKGFEVDYLEGDNNWPEIMRALGEIGFSGWAITEPAYRPPGVDPATRLRQISEKWDKIVTG